MAAATAAHVAGHPMAIRVGGRRMSQSNPIRSPTKNQTSQQQTEPEKTSSPVEVPDYPRPQTPISMKQNNVTENKTNSTEKTEEPPQQQNDNTNGGGGGGGNRQERRKQERRKDHHNNNSEEDQNNGGGGGKEVPFQSSLQRNDAMFNHLQKSKNFDLKHSSFQQQSGGVRINQPAGKFMS